MPINEKIKGKIVSHYELPLKSNTVRVYFTDNTHLCIQFYEDCVETHVRLLEKV